MSKNIKGPPCLYCQAPLRPSRTDRTGLTEEEARELKRVMDPGYRATLRKPFIGEVTWRVSYQAGWGGIGGAFCGNDCASGWAIHRVKAHKFDPRTNRP
jgi:hypothetical protein